MFVQRQHGSASPINHLVPSLHLPYVAFISAFVEHPYLANLSHHLLYHLPHLPATPPLLQTLFTKSHPTKPILQTTSLIPSPSSLNPSTLYASTNLPAFPTSPSQFLSLHTLRISDSLSCPLVSCLLWMWVVILGWYGRGYQEHTHVAAHTRPSSQPAASVLRDSRSDARCSRCTRGRV